jgi:hypothetical protein
MTRNVLLLLLSAIVANGFSPAMYQTSTVRVEEAAKKRVKLNWIGFWRQALVAARSVSGRYTPLVNVGNVYQLGRVEAV